jgi:hypothetical protein
MMVPADGREVLMRVNRGLLGWGVFFLALGGVPLAVQGGVLDASLARRSWELWPLLLIGVGLGLALRNSALDALGGALVAITFGLMAGGLVAAGFGPGSSLALCGIGSTPSNSASAPGLTGSLTSGASVDLSVDCGDLTVAGAPGGGWSIVWPSGNITPQLDASSSARLRLRMGNQHGFGVNNTASKWALTLPNDPDLGLSLSVNAGSARLALGGMHVTSLEASVNAGDTHVDLTGATGTTSVTGSVNAGSLTVALPSPGATLTGSLSANAGSVRVCAPTGVPLRIKVGDHPLGSTNLAQRGLVQNGDTWTRGAWDGATARIDLTVSANLGTITLDPEDGCG